MRTNFCFTNRQGYALAFLRTIVISVVAVVASCDNDDEPAATSPIFGCQLVSSRLAASGKLNDTITFTNEIKDTYSYDDAGNQIGSTSSYDYRTSAGYHQSSNATRSYEYDQNGFLLHSVTQNSSVNGDGSTNYQNSDYTYEYTQDRLVKQTGKTTNDGTTRTFVYIYEYDASGKIVKFYNRDTSAGVIIQYLGSKVVKITYVDEFGNMTYPYIEYNDKGLLVKSVMTRYGDTEEWRYEYNAEGLMTRDERHYNTKPQAAAEYEYDTHEDPRKLVYGERKGHPRIPNTRADPNYTHNVTLLKSFSPDDKGRWQMISSSEYSYTYNAKGFPTNMITKNINRNGIEVGSSSTTYVYENCQ